MSEELADLKRRVNALERGECPNCGLRVPNPWRPVPNGWHGFAPEIFASLRERGIDPSTGHKRGCTEPR